MDASGASHQRASIKRSFSTMANPHPQHREATPFEHIDDHIYEDSLITEDDEEDEEEEIWAYRHRRGGRDPYDPLGLRTEPNWVTQRREEQEQRRGERQEHRHVPGDGLDYRRPMPVVDARAGQNEHQGRVTETVDLTEDDTARAQGAGVALPAATANTAGASRAQRLPRYGRDIIDIASSDEEDNQPPRQPAPRREWPASPVDPRDGAEAIWPGTRRTTSNLRRPGRIRPPSPAMELDDVEIVASRPLSNRPSRRATPAVMQPRSITPFPPGNPAHNVNDTIDLTADDDDDDVVLTRARNAPGGVNADRPAAAGTGVGTRQEPDYGGAGIARLRNMVQGHSFPDRFLENYFHNRPVLDAHRARMEQLRARREQAEAAAGMRANDERRERERERAARRVHPTIGGLFGGEADALIGLPMMMDYGTAAFDMGMGARPLTPPYEAPPAPSNGFTRSPEEEEVVVCPNCGDELALGKDEEKQQLWVIKQCGHAYCGTCVSNRSRSSKGKGKGKAKATNDTLPLTFAKCVVRNCSNTKKLNNKSDFIRVWINS